MHVTPDSNNFSDARLTVQINSPADWTESSLSEVASSRPLRSQATCEHDPTQLIAALEELERKRLAIEALLDAELLWLCLG
jgi:hypothetical protein